MIILCHSNEACVAWGHARLMSKVLFSGKLFRCKHMNYLKQPFINHYFTWCLIVVDINPLQLQLTVTLVTTGGIDAMFITYHLPELRLDKHNQMNIWSSFSNNTCASGPVLAIAHLLGEKMTRSKGGGGHITAVSDSEQPDWTAPNIYKQLIMYLTL